MDRARIREIFLDARELSSSERAAFLERTCGQDATVRDEVLSLLRAEEEAGSYLNETLPAKSTIERVATHEDLSGTTVGHFKLLERIGEGGFGVVYMAEQERPLRRRVAVKILKAGMDSRAILARFDAERQALASMDHPNIARIFDAGTTGQGRPYFAMELLRGTPITQYCDDNRLTPRERVALFLPVCDAVHHAHMKGIIHRDLKPGNVIVTLQDGVPAPKVIDFGIAKALGEPLTDATLFTQFRQIIGTPAYMSPEQAAMSGSDVDTRSDVYSLGVLLYELLVGTTPLESSELLSAGLVEMHRIIRERDPQTPSTRLRTIGARIQTIASHRGTEPARLRRLLRGELDWIVMRALEKDRRRRYDGASALAADLRRYMNGEAVLAGPPSAAYRARRFIQRHRTAVAILSTVALSLMLGTAALLVSYVVVRRERDENALLRRLAEAREAQATELAMRTTLAAAVSAIDAGDGRRAAEALRLVPEGSREWAWHFLFGQTDFSLRTIPLPSAAHRLSPTSAGGVFLSVPRNGNVWSVVDAHSGSILRTVESREVSLSSDAEKLLVLQPDGAFACREVRSWRELWRTEPRLATAEGSRIAEPVCLPPEYTINPDRAISPDGARWVLWQPGPDGDGEIQMRSMADGRLERSFRFPAPIRWLPGFQVHPHGGLAIFSDQDPVDPESGELRPLPADFHMSFSPWFDRTIKLGRWESELTDWTLGRHVTLESRGAEWTCELDVNRSFTFAVSRDDAGIIRTWNLTYSSLKDERRFLALPERVEHVYLTRDGQSVLAVLEGSRRVAVLPAVIGRAAMFRSTDGRICAALARDGGVSFTGGWGDVLAVDTRSLMPMWRRNLSWDWCTAIACTPAGDRVVVAFSSADRNELILLDGRNGETLWSYSPSAEHPGDPRYALKIQAVTFSGDGSRVFIALSGAHGLALDVASGRAQGPLAFPAETAALVASPDRRWIVTTSPRPKDVWELRSPAEGGTLHVLDGNTAQPAWSVPTPFAAQDACWSADGHSIFISAEQHVACVECDTRRVAWSHTPPSGTRFRVLAATPDGAGLLLYRESGRCLVLDALTGEPRVELTLPVDLPIAAAFHRDRSELMVAGVYAPGESLKAPMSASEFAERSRTRAAWELLERLPAPLRFLPTARAEAQLQTFVDVDDDIRRRAVEIHSRLGFSARWANSEVIKIFNKTATGSLELIKDAEQIAARCISEFPAAAAPHLLRARALQLLGRHEEALALLDESEPRMNPGLMRDAHTVQRGISLASLGQTEKARELADSVRERVVNRHTTDTVVIQFLAELDALILDNRPPRKP